MAADNRAVIMDHSVVVDLDHLAMNPGCEAVQTSRGRAADGSTAAVESLAVGRRDENPFLRAPPQDGLAGKVVRVAQERRHVVILANEENWRTTKVSSRDTLGNRRETYADASRVARMLRCRRLVTRDK